YGFLFGSLVRENLGPGGLYYLPPAPFGRWEVWRTRYARKSDIGFRTDLRMLEERRELTRLANPDEWHSPVTAMNADPRQTTYLTADENLLDMSFTVHYTLDDPVAFFYRLDHQHDLVGLYAEAVAREFLARNPLEELLTTRRQEIEEAVRSTLAQRLETIESGIRVTAVRIVDIHPPGETVNAFRDVSSAREDKETRIHRAREKLAGELPRARGEAAGVVAGAQSTADALRTEAEGRSQAFVATAEAVAGRRDLLKHLLWIETAERALAGREKYVVPPGSTGGRVSLWQNPPATSATETTEKKP
ncbi:MAG: protease modulator HflK, partial [bacterium]|nr:protease modulator HflK [bacterium]